MLIFKTLKIEGFGRYATFTRFVLNQPGLNIVIGNNGEGKTTIFEALFWVLYGKTFNGREVSTWEFLRPKEWEGTKVSLSFFQGGDKYKVIRCKDYRGRINGVLGKNRIFLYRNGEEYQFRDKRQTQAKLEAILGFGPDIFLNAVLFPQKGKRFMEESGVRKKEILEQAFSIDWIKEEANKLRSERVDLSQELTALNRELTLIDGSIESIEKDLREFKSRRENFQVEKEAKIQRLLIKKAGLEKERDNLKPPEEPEEFISEQISRLTTEKAGLEKLQPSLRLRTTEKSLAALGESISNTTSLITSLKKQYKKSKETKKCPVCGSTMTDKTHSHYKEDLLNNLNQAREFLEECQGKEAELQKEIVSLSAEVQTLSDLSLELQQYERLQKSWREYRSQLKTKEERIRELEEEIKEVEAEEFQDFSKTLKVRRLKFKRERSKKLKDIRQVGKRLELIEWAIKKPFGSNGLNVFIFNLLLDRLNERLAIYSDLAGFQVKFILHSTGVRENVEAIIYKEGYPVSFWDLSAGEQQVANLVAGFAQADILVGENAVGFFAGDEILESLDSSNVEKVGNFLQRLVKDEKSVFIITHQRSFRPSGANVITIRK